MRVIKIDTDYDVYLTPEDIDKVVRRGPVLWSLFPQYPAISAIVECEQPLNEELELVATRDYDELHHPQTYDGIYFGRDDKGPIIHVYVPLLASLLSEREFLVTRYDGFEAKIWIRKVYGVAGI